MVVRDDCSGNVYHVHSATCVTISGIGTAVWEGTISSNPAGSHGNIEDFGGRDS